MFFQGPTQVGDSGDKREHLRQEVNIDKKQMNLPIGSYFRIPDEIPSFQMDKGNSIQVKEPEIFKKSTLQGLLQVKSSFEDWQGHFNSPDYFSIEGNSSDSWHHYITKTCSKNNTVKKVTVKPLKHKKILQKPKAKCLHGKSKTKRIKEILMRDTSNLLQKSKLFSHQDKSKENSTEWFRSFQFPQEESSDWFRNADINMSFEAMLIGCKQLPGTEHFYDMKDLTNECENIQKQQEINNFRIIPYIKECENLRKDISNARNPPIESMYQSSNEVDELAGYLDNMLQIPKEMSAMAKAMYT